MIDFNRGTMQDLSDYRKDLGEELQEMDYKIADLKMEMEWTVERKVRALRIVEGLDLILDQYLEEA